MINYISALIGDYYGSAYEFNNFDKTRPMSEITGVESKTIPHRFTDDTVCTVAVMDWLNECGGNDMEVLIDKLKEWGRKYNHVGYGSMFKEWLNSESREPIGSFGNGSAMRVSPCAFYADTLDKCLYLAEKSAMVTHNSDEGIRGAKAVATAIFLAKVGVNKEHIKHVVSSEFGYNLNKGLDEIGTNVHKFNATCQVTVPEAIIVFLNENDFISTIERAIYIGGDSDTIAAMSAPIAEAYYGVPHYLTNQFRQALPEDMKDVIKKFNNKVTESF